MELFATRTSCRSYLDTPVPDAMLNKCLEAARLAPSACNRQPWRFVIVKDPAIRADICHSGFLPGIPMPWAAKAPVIVVLCIKKSLLQHQISPLISGIDYPMLDCGIAGEHFVLAAEAQGLGTCWIGWFKVKKVKRLLKLPFGVKPVSLLTLGFPDEKTEPRSRLPLDEISRIL